jgi:hypothetical protein
VATHFAAGRDQKHASKSNARLVPDVLRIGEIHVAGGRDRQIVGAVETFAHESIGQRTDVAFVVGDRDSAAPPERPSQATRLPFDRTSARSTCRWIAKDGCFFLEPRIVAVDAIANIENRMHAVGGRGGSFVNSPSFHSN